MSSLAQDARIWAINTVLGRSKLWLLLSVVAAVGTAVFLTNVVIAYAAAVVLAVIGAASVLVSLRFYSPWLSWLAWFVPAIPFFVVAEPVRNGSISIFSVIHAYALAAVIMFGAFFVARDRLRKWIG